MATPAIVTIKSSQSHLPPQLLSLNSRAEAIPHPASKAVYQHPSDRMPIMKPPKRCCQRWDSFNQFIIKYLLRTKIINI